ncbi:MAG: hypothetical protein Q7U78_07795, partial [Gallionella sp.]|nr:hypothetical protein [Gallionella sp.]
VSGFTLNEQARRHTPPKRVRFTTDRQFASSCSPPRLATTQLPSATEIWHTPTRTFTVLFARLHGRTHSAKAGIQWVYQMGCSVLFPALRGVGLIICLRHVLGGKHHFAGLQADTVAALQTFQYAFRFLAAIGDDFGELFQQGFGHKNVFTEK